MVRNDRICKFILPDKRSLVIHANVINLFLKYTQNNLKDVESGGFLIGYENKYNKSIIIEDITTPKKDDGRGVTYFKIRDVEHYEQIKESNLNDSFFLGSWHTHPQDYVYPSVTDWLDWKKSIRRERPGAKYMLFIIVGRKEICVWSADMTVRNKKILKLTKIS